MSELTLQLVQTVLEHDPEVTDDTRSRVLAMLRADRQPVQFCGEREAAKLLGISAMTLCNWRRGLRRRAASFPFTVYPTPAGTFRYDRAEILSYVDEHMIKRTAAQA